MIGIGSVPTVDGNGSTVTYTYKQRVLVDLDHKKLTFFLAAQYRSKLWMNDIYTYYIRTFVKFGVTRPSEKKVIKVQRCVFAFSLSLVISVRRSRN